MKLTLQNTFYILAIIALILTIVQIIDNLMDDDEEDKHDVHPQTQYVVMPWISNYRPYWWRFRRNVPWIGPRPGGGWVGRFGRRHPRRHHKRGGRRGRH